MQYSQSPNILSEFVHFNVKIYKFKHKKIELYITGKFSEQMIYTMQNAGLEIIKIKDITPIPANGCRPPKLRTKKLVKIKWRPNLKLHFFIVL